MILILWYNLENITKDSILYYVIIRKTAEKVVKKEKIMVNGCRRGEPVCSPYLRIRNS